MVGMLWPNLAAIVVSYNAYNKYADQVRFNPAEHGGTEVNRSENPVSDGPE